MFRLERVKGEIKVKEERGVRGSGEKLREEVRVRRDLEVFEGFGLGNVGLLVFRMLGGVSRMFFVFVGWC